MLSIDPSQLMMLAIAAVGGFVVKQLATPGKKAISQIEQVQWALIAAAGAYLVKTFEQRGDRQEDLRVALAAMEGRLNEQIKTLFNEVETLKEQLHDELSRRPTATRAAR
ncbi:MAG: hypothetical protein KGL39_25310 [Patescibacteria group bacterium]|nr:hypothetical protein [Patescibacteria group bacterium]